MSHGCRSNSSSFNSTLADCHLRFHSSSETTCFGLNGQECVRHNSQVLPPHKLFKLDTDQRWLWDTSWALGEHFGFKSQISLASCFSPSYRFGCANRSTPLPPLRGPELSGAEFQLPTTMPSIICGSMCRLPSMPLTVSEVSLWLHHRLALNLIKKEK